MTSKLASISVAVAAIAAALSLALSGCAASPPGVASNSGSTEAVAARVTSPTRISTAGFVVILPRAVTKFADASATLTPLHSSTAFISAASAFRPVSRGVLAWAGLTSGVPKAALYSYSNSTYGDIQHDGSVSLEYTKTPVWMFTVALSRFVDLSQGGPGATPPTARRSDCLYYYLVDATTGKFLTAGEECAPVSAATHH
jgi:hypothetical protein